MPDQPQTTENRLPSTPPGPGVVLVPALGGIRLAFGLAMALRPAMVGRLLGLPAGESRRWAFTVGMVAAREIGLGAGTLRAWSRGEDTTGWVAAQATADAGDALAALLAARAGHLPSGPARRMAVLAASGVLAELATVAALQRR